MKKIARTLTHTLLLAALLALCAALAAAEGAPVSLTDMYGRSVTLDAPATRIVALTAADCEILCALGAGDALVGRGEYCNYPEEILDVPLVQSGTQTNIEQILALAPQVVVMGDMAQSKDVVDMLEQSGVRVVVSNADTLEGVYAAIDMLGALLGKEGEAQALAGDMQAAFEEIAAQCENAGKTVYFEVSPLQYGLWTAGKGTFMDEIAAICGLTNAFEDVEGWAQISQEQVLARDPDYIVTIAMDFGGGPTPVEEIMGRTGWEGLKAVKNGHVLNMNSDEISRPGPRLEDAARMLFRFIRSAEGADAL